MIFWSLLVSDPPVTYIFSAVLIIACTLFAAWYAWNWNAVEAQP